MGKILVASVALAVASAFQPARPRPYLVRVPLGLDEAVPSVEENPLTVDKVRLGRTLFFDTRLSSDGTVACASCHVPERAFTDGRRVAVGVGGRRGTRNAPTLFNRTYGVSQFWDGRVRSLEAQVLEPIKSPREMGMTLGRLERRLQSTPEYTSRFSDVFDEPPTAGNVANAIAAFVRTLVSADSPFDRFEHGERGALSPEARQGLDLFIGKANCVACHVGHTLTDEQFHNTGVAWNGRRFLDQGRFAVSSRPDDRGAFKTPTLREIARTGPYMHDGRFDSLDAVIDFYDRGGTPNPHLDTEIGSLSLTAEERRALVTFLHALTGTMREGVPGAASSR